MFRSQVFLGVSGVDARKSRATNQTNRSSISLLEITPNRRRFIIRQNRLIIIWKKEEKKSRCSVSGERSGFEGGFKRRRRKRKKIRYRTFPPILKTVYIIYRSYVSKHLKQSSSEQRRFTNSKKLRRENTWNKYEFDKWRFHLVTGDKDKVRSTSLTGWRLILLSAKIR